MWEFSRDDSVLSWKYYMDRQSVHFCQKYPYMDHQSVHFWKKSLYMDRQSVHFCMNCIRGAGGGGDGDADGGGGIPTTLHIW